MQVHTQMVANNDEPLPTKWRTL